VLDWEDVEVAVRVPEEACDELGERVWLRDRVNVRVPVGVPLDDEDRVCESERVREIVGAFVAEPEHVGVLDGLGDPVEDFVFVSDEVGVDDPDGVDEAVVLGVFVCTRKCVL